MGNVDAAWCGVTTPVPNTVESRRWVWGGVSLRQWIRGSGKRRKAMRIAKYLGANASRNQVASAEGGRIDAKAKAKALSDLESQCKLGSGRCRRRPGVPFGEGYAFLQPTEKH